MGRAQVFVETMDKDMGGAPELNGGVCLYGAHNSLLAIRAFTRLFLGRILMAQQSC